MDTHLPQDFGTIVIVLHGVLYKAEAINITDKRVAVCSEEVKTTNCLLHWKVKKKTFYLSKPVTADKTLEARFTNRFKQ